MDAALWPEEVSVGEVVYPPGGGFGPRMQRNLQLVMIHSGAMTVAIDGELRHAAAGTIAVLFPGHEERFTFAPNEETRHSWLHATLPQLDGGLRARMELLPWPLPLSPALGELTRSALALRSSPLSTAVPLLKALAAQLFWRYIGEGEARRGRGSAAVADAIERARQFIADNIDRPLTLAEVAAAAAVSPAHLTRLFRARLGTTPMAYLWGRRVALGVELLQGTGLPVGVIATRCGFQTSYHFSRRVRETTGAPPLDIRRRAWAGNEGADDD